VAVPKPDYLSRDYQGLRQSLLQYAQQVYPEWQPSSEGDFGMVMVELFSYMGDILSYYTDRAQFENYLPTATQRDSILNLAFMLGYTPNSGAPATGTVPLTTDKGTPATVVPAGTQITTNRVDTLDGPVVFETDEDVSIPANPAGTIPAVNATVTEGTSEIFQYLGESTGLPSQTFLLPHTGVYSETIRIYIEDGTGSTIISPGTAQVVAREWIRVDKLLEADDADKVFESRFNASSTNVYFGDDINGAIPATGLRVYASYRHGFGAAGNVAVGAVRLLNTTGVDGLGVVKVATDAQGGFLSTAMTGGADPESDDSIRFNAPKVYRTQNRAVTEQDFLDIALGTQGVSKASVLSGTFTSVTIYVTGADGGAPSETVKKAVAERLAGKTLAGVDVTIAAPTFITVNFGKAGENISVVIDKTYSNKAVRSAIIRNLRAYVRAMPFGEKMSVSNIYQVFMDVEGVKAVDINVMARADSPQTGTSMITPKPWEVFAPGLIYFAVTGGVA
jgi:uncharacterized phage protein gp47/JayE